eukprot:5017345-Prymnesium_polylepis.1
MAASDDDCAGVIASAMSAMHQNRLRTAVRAPDPMVAKRSSLSRPGSACVLGAGANSRRPQQQQPQHAASAA